MLHPITNTGRVIGPRVLAILSSLSLRASLLKSLLALILIFWAAGPAVAGIYTVTNTDNAGPGSLRQAILDANGSPGTDTIEFAISGAGPHTISLLTTLNDITDPVIIDGTTQPGFSGSPLIVLDGGSAGAGVTGLTITAGGSTVKGLVIHSFDNNGIKLSGASGNTITGNYIGTDADGMSGLPNGTGGLWIDGINSNTIGGTTAAERNVIAGNEGDAITLLNGATTNVIQGNYIGADKNGTASPGNAGRGIFIDDSPDNTIGGTANGAGNIISGFDDEGILITGSSATGNDVQGNYIGTDKNGTAVLMNFASGITITNGASNNTIGGTTIASRNIISGNLFNGIWITGSGTTANVIQGNYIGTDVNGTSDLGNAGSGIHVASSNGNVIGGTGATAGNIIAFNAVDGINIASGTENQILRNSTFTNTSLGINLGVSGITANDPGDADTGANNLQNFPEITSAYYDSGLDEVTVTYSVPTDPAHAVYPLRVEFFVADPDGQGETYIGFDVYTNTDYTGGPDKTPPPFTPEAPVSGTDEIIATATDDDGNTSEFTPISMLLPVELIAFDAVADGNAVLLRWQTASETNNAGFEIQSISKKDGVTQTISQPTAWEAIDFVEGYGTTELSQQYTYRVEDLAPGRHVFRLKQIDFDGTFEYHPEVEVIVEMVERFAMEPVYPNPFNPQAQFRFAVHRTQQVSVALYDLLGRRVKLLYAGSPAVGQMHAVRIDGSGLPSGLYLVRVVGERFVETQTVTLLR